MLRTTPAVVQIGFMSVPVIVRLPDLAATEALAERLAAVTRAGDAILLEGPLGAGKTALARAFLRAAAGDPAMEVPSPSFTLVQIYDTKIGPVFHYDLWRLDGSSSMTELDWEDALDGIIIVEWPDRLGNLRPDDALTITLRLGDGEAREATLLGWENRLQSLSAVDKVGADGQDPFGDDDNTAVHPNDQAAPTPPSTTEPSA
jgi:tRNA threonylcarbamoyladenosine biosynthesis protein TsaE